MRSSRSESYFELCDIAGMEASLTKAQAAAPGRCTT